jgi:hypothetical protein
LKKKVKFLLGGALAEDTGVQVESGLRNVVAT